MIFSVCRIGDLSESLYAHFHPIPPPVEHPVRQDRLWLTPEMTWSKYLYGDNFSKSARDEKWRIFGTMTWVPYQLPCSKEYGWKLDLPPLENFASGLTWSNRTNPSTRSNIVAVIQTRFIVEINHENTRSAVCGRLEQKASWGVGGWADDDEPGATVVE
jgi:hypothetical protein